MGWIRDVLRKAVTCTECQGHIPKDEYHVHHTGEGTRVHNACFLPNIIGSTMHSIVYTLLQVEDRVAGLDAWHQGGKNVAKHLADTVHEQLKGLVEPTAAQETLNLPVTASFVKEYFHAHCNLE